MLNRLQGQIRLSCAATPARHVYDQKYHNPNGIDEVPIPGDQLDAVRCCSVTSRPSDKASTISMTTTPTVTCRP